MSYHCGKCKRALAPTELMEKRRSNNPQTVFYCEQCRKQMVDERIAHKMKWVKKE